MKCLSLTLFVLFLLNCSITSKRIYKEVLTSKDSMALNVEPEIYFQKVYSGSDPLKTINLSDQDYIKFTISVNSQTLVLKTIPADGSIGDIYNTINLKDIYSDNIDDASKSICCSKMQIINYEENTSNSKKSEIVGFEANNCLEIRVDNDFTWRLCSESKSIVESLQFQIKVSIIILMGKTVDYKALIQNSFVDTNLFKNWSWHNQLNWGSECINSEFNLQSPITLEDQKPSSIPGASDETKLPFLIDYYFDSAEPTITSFGRENIVGFTEYIGLIRLSVGEKSVIYQPNFMSFRFKSEHEISTKRFDGEIEIHFTEVNPNKKSWLTNGLVISIFMESVKESKSLSMLEDLKLDFWKFELKDKMMTNFKPGKPFCLQCLVDEVFKLDTNYYIYKGSLSTPPCTSNVLRIVFDRVIKIPELQFKVLREQSLLDQKEKEIHSRINQKPLKRVVIKKSCASIKFNNKLNDYLGNSLSLDAHYASLINLSTVSGLDAFNPANKELIRDAIIKIKPAYKLGNSTNILDLNASIACGKGAN